MKKARMAACVCVGSIVTVLIWHFICGCHSPAGPDGGKTLVPTPPPASESREALIREGVIKESPVALPAGPAAVRKVSAPVAVREAAAPVAVREVPAPVAVREVPAPVAVREIPAPTAVRNVPAPTAVRPPAAPPTTYRIEKGDTLWSIARQFKTSVTALQKANGISDPGKISVGQELVIPSAGGGV